MNLDKFPFLGDFRELEYGRPDSPSLRGAVRATESKHGRDLIRYLRSGSLLIATPSAVRDVLSPRGAVIRGLHLLTDGKWLWFSDLSHYVERYHVALDRVFIQHAQSNHWTVPGLSDSDSDAMLTTLIGAESAETDNVTEHVRRRSESREADRAERPYRHESDGGP
ncbi:MULTISPECIES: hypothetical protein [unclassified Streptomyces]|uniref:hypothetical protein n=1 Tax=unclassified Streptomyces TaxID=2593676 RepID=UPI0008E4E2F5|nr:MULTISPECIES: hypothetical protein [unclassified Streptomyces]SFN49996.1 hypothetical protein SAMN04487980_102244 [Streptomyces sp. cf124]